VFAVLIARAFELPWPAEIAVLLMAISPGAPAALRRSQFAGGHRAFAPSLQICAMILAVISVPLSIVALDHVYSGHASVAPWHVARQVFVAQLLPLGLGIALRRASAPIAERLERWFQRIAIAMLVVTVVIVLIDVWEVAVTAGLRVLAAIVLITGAALMIGHWLGGPEPAMRTTVAIASASRNPGLALLVATLNAGPPQVSATVLAYLAVSLLTIVLYGAWRRHAG
jgi:BASS family bile acid:Na+ symporter